jgi:hypothetical protein
VERRKRRAGRQWPPRDPAARYRPRRSNGDLGIWLIALAYEAGRDICLSDQSVALPSRSADTTPASANFWLARWLIARGIEAHVIHSASVAVSRERKRAKSLDASMSMRVFRGWLRGERGHCGMLAIPTMAEKDARHPRRERESLVNEHSRITNRMKSALAGLGMPRIQATSAPERLAGLRTAEGTGLPANIIWSCRRPHLALLPGGP